MSYDTLKIKKTESLNLINQQIQKGEALLRKGHSIIKGKSKYDIPARDRDLFESAYKQWADITYSILNRVYRSSKYTLEFKNKHSSKVEYVSSSWVPDIEYYLSRQLIQKLDYLKMLRDSIDDFREEKEELLMAQELSKEEKGVDKMSLEKITFVSSDIVDSTGIKKRHALSDVTRTFDAYHNFLDKMIASLAGEVWTKSGDGVDFFFQGDKSEISGFACALAILDNLRTFNLCESFIDEEIKVRLSIGTIALELDTKEYGRISHPDIDKICKAQKNIVNANQIAILDSAYQNMPPKIRRLLSQRVQDRDILYIFGGVPFSEHKIFQESMLELPKVEHNRYAPKDVPINIAISQELNFLVLVKLADLNQKFIIYYQFSTDRKEKFWIGYSKQGENSQNYVTRDENTQPIDIRNSTHIFILENVSKTITRRFPKIQGTPERVIQVRLRADDAYTIPVAFHFDFFEKKRWR